MNVFKDLKRTLPSYQPHITFDVGGNIGQTVIEIIKEYPCSQVYSFEPIPSTYEKLKKNTKDYKNVTIENVALSNADGEVLMVSTPESVSNRIITPETPSRSKLMVSTIRGDKYIEMHGISRVNILKIDTEGHDLEVVKGFQNMINLGLIDFIQLEAGVSRVNDRHVHWGEVKAFFEILGFEVFGLYDQTKERSGFPVLRRVNMVFVSKNMISSYKDNR